MKFKVFLLLILLCLFAPVAVFGELSVTNKWRIEQATRQCAENHNAIQYREYWQDTVSKESDEVVCMAEQVAGLIVAEGDEWLDKKALELIENCKEQAKKDMSVYFLCLQKNLDRTTRIISSACTELGKENLWDKEQCKRLVTFIFMKKFEVVLEEHKPQIKKINASIDEIKKVKVVRTLFNPIMAIIFFYLLALVVVFWIDGGNWMRISIWGFVTGPFIIASCILQGGWRFFLSGIAILILLIFVLCVQRKAVLKFINKIKKKIGF